jgi:hypothetical protein
LEQDFNGLGDSQDKNRRHKNNGSIYSPCTKAQPKNSFPKRGSWAVVRQFGIPLGRHPGGRQTKVAYSTTLNLKHRP